MVKIVNEFGDVKTGVQGEAVYQTKYGQQMRSARAPKRAIASNEQVEHRQLYKDALDWRKTLTVDNRRFLEGYCISHYVVDKFKMPLAWHRFALAIFLTKPEVTKAG